MHYQDRVWYGGDYNPDQWNEDIWNEDFTLFEEAHVNMVTLPVFSWSRIQPNEDTFDFEWLIKLLDRTKEEGIGVCLATSTAVQPAWLSKKYPDILPVDAHGMKKRFGGRVKFCPNSEDYRKAAGILVTKLANIARDYDHVVMWHIGNEYDNYCYCDTCRDKFRDWVAARYKTVDQVNKSWNLRFWGHGISSFDEIEIPDFRTENWEMAGLERTNFQTINLDYKRFMNESIQACYMNEVEIVNEITPELPVTTNFMGSFKPLDYNRFAKLLDIISWDHYPALGDPPFKSALQHDLMRSLKKDKPFWLMEQSPSQQNWAPYNTLKRPGELRLQSYQTMAHGADAIMYFQMRRSIANCEKFHGALIDHVGSNKTRVFRECKEIGQELSGLSEMIGSKVYPKTAIVFDWENWWAIEMSSGPSIALNYMDVITRFYQGLYSHSQAIDFVWEEDDLSGYDQVYAPLLYMVSDKMANLLDGYVKEGGQLVLTTFSGLVDLNDHVTTEGYPGPFRKMAGIWVEEIDGLLPDMTNGIEGFNDKEYTGTILCDVIHNEGAQVLARFTKDFYADYPVLTKNNWGKGHVYYIGTIPTSDFIEDFHGSIKKDGHKKPTVWTDNEEVEITYRLKGDWQYAFIMNYGSKEAEIWLESPAKELLTGQDLKDLTICKAKDAMVIKTRYNG